MLTVCYINRQAGRGYHYSDTNACGESAASNNVWTVITFVGRARIYTPIEGATKDKFQAALNVAKRNNIDLLSVGK